MFYTDPSGNVCPEGTKDPLLRAPVPSPNQQQSTALVPYDPDFAAKQNALYGNGYANANKSVPNSGRQLANFIVGPEGTIVSRDLYTKSNADFIQEVANISNAKINAQLTAQGKKTTGHVAGSLKHGEAANIARSYQLDIENRGLEIEQNYLNHEPISSNVYGSTRLDVYDTKNHQYYDYKFVINPGNSMSDKQINKILAQGPAGLTKSNIHEVNPTN